VNDPRPPAPALQARLLAELSPVQIAELTLTVALASAFSRISIAWGPPADMPVLEVPTPTPEGSVG
jgi:alkylhydroperoxidase family enzyme